MLLSIAMMGVMAAVTVRALNKVQHVALRRVTLKRWLLSPKKQRRRITTLEVVPSNILIAVAVTMLSRPLTSFGRNARVAMVCY
ncbi:hypothetical protein [Roseiconus lacunae]|uniref:hypothetical protein n=1 Tax=Roseiconus lacunae TaxID=2605694 RepID=UPI001E2ED7BF|nr:hypothetical protein [Roseiconus lacunae]MCD0461023.1 hypothetical protein [Roseiconus lacunae]